MSLSKGLHTQNLKQLVSGFATAVTDQTYDGHDWIARNGDDSLFNVFQELLPQVWHICYEHISMLKYRAT